MENIQIRILVDDFYNKLMTDIIEIFYNGLNYNTYPDNYFKVKYIVECYSNGCFGYESFIKQLTKALKVDREQIEILVKQYLTNDAKRMLFNHII